MKKKSIIYIAVNLIVLLLSVVLFIRTYGTFKSCFALSDGAGLIVISCMVLVVHLIKALRLYIILYGSGMHIMKYLKLYCKLLPVSVLLPFKMGEFFRIYCYGNALGNMVKGLVTVCLDRFMDTIALVTMILLLWVLNIGELPVVVYILFIFLVLAVVAYFVIPGLFSFWKSFLIKARATEKRLVLLRLLSAGEKVYDELARVAKGRGVVLYVLSLLGWSVEIGGIIFLNKVLTGGGADYSVSKYLSAAIGIGQSAELMQFIFISIVLMIAGYAGIKLYEFTVIKNKRL